MHPNSTRYLLCLAALSLVPLACADADGFIEPIGAQPDGSFGGASAGADALAGSRGPSEQTEGFDLDVSATGDDVTLDFSPVSGATTYTLWSSSDPYFAPGDAGATIVTTSGTPSLTVAGGAIGNDSVFWRVITDGGDVSTTAGRWVQPLVPGYNSLGFPLLETGLYSAETLAAAYPQFTEVWGLVSDLGGFLVWRGTGEDDILWAAGGSTTVFNAGGSGFFRQLGLVAVDGDIAGTLPAGGVTLTAPLSMESTDAMGLAAELPTASIISTYDESTQTILRFYPPDWGPNFDIEPGQALWITADTPIDWPPGYEPPPQSACDGRVEPNPTPGNECVIWETAGGVQTDYTAAVMAASPASPYALDLSGSGTLTLCEGTYPMHIAVANAGNAGTNISVVGAGSGLTVLDSGHHYGVLHGANDGAFLVEGLTVTGTGWAFVPIGRSDYSFVDIGSVGNERGFITLHKHFLTVDNGWFRNNTLDGMAFDAANHDAGQAATPGGHSLQNVCVEDNGGRGIASTFSDLLEVSGSEIRNNGGVQIDLSNVRTVTLDDLLVSGHDGNNAAVTMLAYSSNPNDVFSTNVTMSGLTVTGNSSTNLAAGGIVNLQNANVTCTDSVVEDNSPGNLLGVSCSLPE